MADKIKKRDGDAEFLKKDLKTKTDLVHSLELQVDTIPILKNKIKELEKIASSNYS